MERHLPGVLAQGRGHQITVRQLLDHSSGIPEYTDRIALYDTEAYPTEHDSFDRFFDAMLTEKISLEQILRLINERPPVTSPGEKFVYSNSNYILLSMLIERLTGRTMALP